MSGLYGSGALLIRAEISYYVCRRHNSFFIHAELLYNNCFNRVPHKPRLPGIILGRTKFVTIPISDIIHEISNAEIPGGKFPFKRFRAPNLMEPSSVLFCLIVS